MYSRGPPPPLPSGDIGKEGIRKLAGGEDTSDNQFKPENRFLSTRHPGVWQRPALRLPWVSKNVIVSWPESWLLKAV